MIGGSFQAGLVGFSLQMDSVWSLCLGLAASCLWWMFGVSEMSSWIAVVNLGYFIPVSLLAGLFWFGAAWKLTFYRSPYRTLDQVFLDAVADYMLTGVSFFFGVMGGLTFGIIYFLSMAI